MFRDDFALFFVNAAMENIGIGTAGVHAAAEKAVGADIL